MDPLIISGNDHSAHRLALRSAIKDMQNQRLACEVRQRLARESGARKAGGDDGSNA
jgi:hypothetical protein